MDASDADRFASRAEEFEQLLTALEQVGRGFGSLELDRSITRVWATYQVLAAEQLPVDRTTADPGASAVDGNLHLAPGWKYNSQGKLVFRRFDA